MITDTTLMQYIDQLFLRFDVNGSGSLTVEELYLFFNELFTLMGSPIRINPQQATQAMAMIDVNRDGHATKPEIFQVFKHMLKAQNYMAPQQQQYYPQQQYMQQPPQQQYMQQQPPQQQYGQPYNPYQGYQNPNQYK